MGHFRQSLFVLSLSFFIGLSACTDKPVEMTFFEDVSKDSGLDQYTGMTHGIFWRDIDNDGFPDVYLTNHLNKAQLFRNTGMGRFEDVTAQYLSAQKNGMGDKHGAAWADFNNDGRQDLVQLTGAGRGIGAEAKFLLENQGGKLVDVATQMGVENVHGRTRMPLWFDVDNNGLLDLFQGAEQRFDDKSPPMFFAQHGDVFKPSEDLKFASKTTPFCMVTSLNSEAKVDILCRMTGKGHTSQVFRINGANVIGKSLLPATGFNDVAAADFDNNGLIDLVLARKNGVGSIGFGLNEKTLIVDMRIDSKNVSEKMGFTFRTEGEPVAELSSTFPKDAITLAQVYLGDKGNHPNSFTFSLSDLKGIKTSVPGVQAGVYIGMLENNLWGIEVTAPEKKMKPGTNQQITIKIKSTQKIADLKVVGGVLKDEKAPIRLLMNYGGKLVKEGDERGVHAQIAAGTNIVAADIDNDMDVDIFMIASGDIGHRENVLLLNDGDGHFDLVALSGGAMAGEHGVADAITTVDFDNDGFLDLLISSGGSMGRSLGLPADGGRYQLYRNVGNDHHWLKIDLEGVESNRDGIGAVVKLTVGGITQVRIQDNGMHNNAQNDKRLHFGLGKNTKIDKIVVHWPSGKTQTLKDVSPNNVLRIRESRSE